jgi:hypothetical protein
MRLNSGLERVDQYLGGHRRTADPNLLNGGDGQIMARQIAEVDFSMDRDTEPSHRVELALALFCVCGVGVPIVIPDLVAVGATICLLSAAAAGWLYARDLARMPLWFWRHRIQAKIASRDTWLGAWLALAVICLGVGAPGYRLYQLRITPAATPSVILLWEDQQLKIYNHDNNDIYFWGYKFDDERPSIMDIPRVIAAAIPGSTTFYYLPWPRPEDYAQKVIGENGDKLVPFEAYLKNHLQIKYTAKFYILIDMKNSVLGIRTQQLGIVPGGW